MKSWLDFAAASDNDNISGVLLNADGPGNCIKCHSVSETDELRVEWQAADAKTKAHYKFNHAPHLSILGPGSQCDTCHKLNVSAKYSAAFKPRDPDIFESNFKNINKQTCTQCHAEQKVTQNCSSCHEYHHDVKFKGNAVASNLAKQSKWKWSN